MGVPSTGHTKLERLRCSSSTEAAREALLNVNDITNFIRGYLVCHSLRLMNNVDAEEYELYCLQPSSTPSDGPVDFALCGSPKYRIVGCRQNMLLS